MIRRLSLPLLLLLFALTFVTCARAPSHDNETGSDTLTISITDAPFPYETVKSAVVAIRRVELRGSDGLYHTLMDFGEGHEVDLVPLRNGVAERLGGAAPPAGLYDAIRVTLEAREIVIDDAGLLLRFTEFVHDAADATVEAELVEPIEVDPGTLKSLLLDLDLARSFLLEGPEAIDGFRFAPVLRAVNEDRAGSLAFRRRIHPHRSERRGRRRRCVGNRPGRQRPHRLRRPPRPTRRRIPVGGRGS